MRPERRRSRRRFLGIGTAVVGGILAGCSGERSSETSPTASTPRGPVEAVTVEGADLVVTLGPDHDVDRLHLLAPDGTEFRSAAVAEGQTRVALALLAIEPGPGLEHYQPGVHRLVAVEAAGEWTVDVPLRPRLELVDVAPFRDGERATDRGRLAATVANRGTGPTWVHDVTYSGAPNPAANAQLADDPGAPLVDRSSEPSSLVVGPGEEQRYVGAAAPLLFGTEGDETPHCAGEVAFDVLVGAAVGEPLVGHVRATLGGEPVSAGLTGEYACPDVRVALDAGGPGA